MKKKLLSLLFIICAISFANAQIPVTDAAMNFNTTANQITNAVTWGNQLLKLKEQASILTTTLKFVTDVSSFVRDAAYAKSLIERQSYIVNRCSHIVRGADKVDLSLAKNLGNNISSFLQTNNSLVSLISSTLTSKFKMNDSARLGALMNVKKEQDALLEKMHATEMILNTVVATNEILEFQLFK